NVFQSPCINSIPLFLDRSKPVLTAKDVSYITMKPVWHSTQLIYPVPLHLPLTSVAWMPNQQCNFHYQFFYRSQLVNCNYYAETFRKLKVFSYSLHSSSHSALQSRLFPFQE